MSTLAIVLCALFLASAANSHILPELPEVDAQRADESTQESETFLEDARNLHVLPINCSTGTGKCIQLGLQIQPGKFLTLGSLFNLTVNNTTDPPLDLNVQANTTVVKNTTADIKFGDKFGKFMEGSFKKNTEILKLLLSKPGNQIKWFSNVVKDGMKKSKEHTKKVFQTVFRPLTDTATSSPAKITKLTLDPAVLEKQGVSPGVANAASIALADLSCDESKKLLLEMEKIIEAETHNPVKPVSPPPPVPPTVPGWSNNLYNKLTNTTGRK